MRYTNKIKKSFVLILSLSTSLTHAIPYAYQYEVKQLGIESLVEYEVPTWFPLSIKRTTRDRRTQQVKEVAYITLKPITQAHAAALFKLVKENRAFLQEFMPSIVERLGDTMEATQAWIYQNEHQQISDHYTLGVFYRVAGGEERIIGAIGWQCRGSYSQQEQSLDGMYWLGDPAYTGAKGIGTIIVQALFNYIIATGLAKRVVIVAHMNNKASIGVATKLGMRMTSPSHYKEWPYREQKKEVKVFTLSQKAWEKRHLYKKKPRTQ